MSDWSELDDRAVTVELMKAVVLAHVFAHELWRRRHLSPDPTELEMALDEVRSLAMLPFNESERAEIYEAAFETMPRN